MDRCDGRPEVVEVESETPDGEEKGLLGMREISQYETTSLK